MGSTLTPSSSSSSSSLPMRILSKLFSPSSSTSTPPILHHRHHLHTYGPCHQNPRLAAAASSHDDGDSIIVIMGATGTGKTKLSIDIATHFGSEIINSDKIQVYSGLDITTNKVSISDRRGVPHHLLGSVDPSSGEISAASFRSLASSSIDSVLRRRRIPIIAGGSNSFIHALVSDPYDPKYDPFLGGPPPHHSRSNGFRFRYKCCFIWVDVDRTALREYLDQRVDEMVGSGMVEELESYFGNKKREWEKNVGLNRAIGVPEFRGYFGNRWTYEQAVGAIKENTWRLADEQLRKIRRLREDFGWDLRRVDATDTIRFKMMGRGEAHKEVENYWVRDVLGPALGTIEKYLEGGDEEEEEEDHGVIMQQSSSSLY